MKNDTPEARTRFAIEDARGALDLALDLIDQGFAPSDLPAVPSAAALEAIGPEGTADLLAQLAPELEAWRIDGERTALWTVTKLRAALSRRAQAAETAAAMRALADTHEQRVLDATAHDVAYFEGKLREYHEAAIAGSRRKTTVLPDGTKLSTRAGGLSTSIEDEATLVGWLEDHADGLLDYQDPKIKVAELKKVYGNKAGDEPGEYPAVDAETGEVLPAVVFVRGPESYRTDLGDLAAAVEGDDTLWITAMRRALWRGAGWVLLIGVLGNVTQAAWTLNVWYAVAAGMCLLGGAACFEHVARDEWDG